MLAPYTEDAPERETLEAIPGPVMLEFGSNTCGICQAAAPVIADALNSSPVPHIRVQDGKGRRLGRQFGIKLWPTLIMLKDGQEVARVVGPVNVEEIQAAHELIQG